MHRYSSLRATRHRAAHRSGPETGAAAAVCFQAEPRCGCQSLRQARWREEEEEERVSAPWKHTNTAFTHLSLSVNDSNCKDTVSDSQNKDQVYQLLHVDRAYLQTSTAEVGQEAYMKNIAHIKHLYDAWCMYFLGLSGVIQWWCFRLTAGPYTGFWGAMSVNFPRNTPSTEKFWLASKMFSFFFFFLVLVF